MKTTQDPHRQAAVIEISEMLGLKHRKLTTTEEANLLGMFYSVPPEHRGDCDEIVKALEPSLMNLKALDRAETRTTASQSEELRQLLREIAAKATALAGD